ncbi:Hsp20/alpha crystallin family protein [Halalkalicoccus ordinarius]|uniref:Hsp20/alpha crystallin family protein n=1 Tax=Halalkalicoccus ordinarius TaxID=3116651 RepID=UPI00300F5E01
MSGRRNPFDDIEELFNRFSQQFENQSGLNQDVFGMAGGSRMSIDLADRDDEYVVTADTPGFEREEISVRVTDDTLSIEADREESTEQEDETYIRSERRSESMRRSIRLPEPVEEESVSATYRNGVLTITLPKRDAASGGRTIDIE